MTLRNRGSRDNTGAIGREARLVLDALQFHPLGEHPAVTDAVWREARHDFRDPGKTLIDLWEANTVGVDAVVTFVLTRDSECIESGYATRLKDTLTKIERKTGVSIGTEHQPQERTTDTLSRTTHKVGLATGRILEFVRDVSDVEYPDFRDMLSSVLTQRDKNDALFRLYHAYPREVDAAIARAGSLLMDEERAGGRDGQLARRDLKELTEAVTTVRENVGGMLFGIGADFLHTARQHQAQMQISKPRLTQ